MINSGRLVGELIEAKEFISTDRYLDYSNSSGAWKYLKRDYIYKSGIWRDQQIRSLWLDRLKYSKTSLIVGHSDYGTNRIDLVYLRKLGISSVAGVNVHPLAKFSMSLPLGLTNDCDDSPMHRLLGDTSHFERAFSSTSRNGSFMGTVYSSFSVHTAQRERGRLQEMIRDRKGYIWSQPDFSEAGRVQFLADLRTSDFVLCPRGNGVDTHRLWETLYMGGMPIIKRHRYINQLVEDLPVVLVDDWIEILSAGFLEKEWNRINDVPWDLEPLKLSYWLRKLEDNA